MIGTLLAFFAQFSPTIMAHRERTFLMLKPDAVHRNLVGEIISRFEKRGFKLVAMKFVQAPRETLEAHYAEHKGRPFYEGLVNYMASGPVVPMVWEGFNVVLAARAMMGETKPMESKPGSIRGDYAIDIGRNIIHGSDAVDTANNEIALWFKESEIASWNNVSEPWIYE